MAFLAVLREGLETAVFLLATLQASENAELASLGALAGVLVAVGIGVALYRGAVQVGQVDVNVNANDDMDQRISYGSGRLFNGTLFAAVITEDLRKNAEK